MGIKFNADEVIQMAIRAETNAAEYYRAAASKYSASEDVEFLNKMADMEVAHKKYFTAMREELSEAAKAETTFDPYMEATLYLNEMADSDAAEGSREAAAIMDKAQSLKEIVRTAIGMEQNAVLFYSGLKDMVSEKMGKGKIQEILDEEKSHVVILTKELQRIQGS